MSYRILLITYYWPPAGGGGVHRWLKFTKYLSEFGISPVVYTPEQPDYPVVDLSLEKEVNKDLEIWRYAIWEPYAYYRTFMGLRPDKKIYSGFITEQSRETLRQKVSVFIRGNFFIPDARKFWIRPSVRFLTHTLKEHPVDLIVSTGPPHSMHRIAYQIHRKMGIPWIADFRDPWTGIDFYDKLRLTALADWLHHKQEKQVLKSADCVVTVSPQWKKDLEEISGREVDVFTNGYDEKDFEDQQPLSTDFTITHLGSINPDRNAIAFWIALDQLLSQDQELSDSLRLRLVGPVDQSVVDTLDNLPKLSAHVEFVEWMDHTDAIVEMRQAQLLLLLLNDTPNKYGILPGKLFEYLAARRPLICIGPTDGDAAAIIHECAAGEVIDYGDTETMRNVVARYFAAFRGGAQLHGGKQERVMHYARRNIVQRYAKKMVEIIEGKKNV